MRFLCILACSLLTSCALLHSYYELSLYDVDSPFDKEVKIIEIQKPHKESGGHGVASYVGGQYLYEDDVISILWQYDIMEGNKFHFTLQNVSEYTIRIPWNEMLYTDIDRNVSSVDNRGYSDNFPISIAPSATTLSGTVYPNIGYSTLFPQYSSMNKFHKSETLIGRRVQIYFPIEMNGKTFNYIFVFKIEDVAVEY